MKNLLLPLGVVGGALLLWIGLRKKTAFDKIRIQIENIVPDLVKKSITLNLRVTNPTLEKIDIRAIAGGLSVGNTFVGNVLSTLPTGVMPGQTLMIPVNISVTATDILNLVLSYVTSRASGPVTFFFDGNVDFAGVILPLRMEYTLQW